VDRTRAAAFVAVGSELLRAGKPETNSVRIAELLRPCGFRLVEKRCVEDDAAAIAAALLELSLRAALVVVSGGLGPTADDVTREGAAEALARPLVRRPELVAALAERYRSLGREMPEVAARMADILEGAEVLRNPRGTAPGQLLTAGDTTFVLLPGVPWELEEIFARHLLPRWQSAAGVEVRTLRLAGVYESAVEQRVSPLYDRFGRDAVTILAGRGLVDLVLVADGDGAAARLAEMVDAFRAVVGPDLYGVDDDTLAAVVLGALRRRGLRLAVAESCTGGKIGERLTAVPGSSEAFVGGIVAYSDALKRERLGVPAALLAAHGAVSREVAEAMARGALALGADCAIAVTGVAGPGGGSDDKPVGTVHLAAATPGGVRLARHRFPGHRELVREFAATFALDLLRLALEEEP
jgi:nicotinamide-nucleotide amidase